MVSIKYTYNINNDFPDYRINDLLPVEIQESNIDIKLDYINIYENTCDIWFIDTLSAANKIILDNIIASHPSLKILKFIKCQEVDANTDQLIETGFSYQGNQYSIGLLGFL